MSEVKIISKGRKINYSGLFNVNKVHKFIMQWLRENDFTQFEEKTEEQVFPEGKQIIYKYRPFHKFTDFAKAIIFLDITMKNVKDVEIELDDKKQKMQKGDIEISITGYIETDYKNKWETKPFYYFFKIVAEKFFLGGHRHFYEKFVKKRCDSIYEDIKDMLNIHSLKA